MKQCASAIKKMNIPFTCTEANVAKDGTQTWSLSAHYRTLFLVTKRLIRRERKKTIHANLIRP